MQIDFFSTFQQIYSHQLTKCSNISFRKCNTTFIKLCKSCLFQQKQRDSSFNLSSKTTVLVSPVKKNLQKTKLVLQLLNFLDSWWAPETNFLCQNQCSRSKTFWIFPTFPIMQLNRVIYSGFCAWWTVVFKNEASKSSSRRRYRTVSTCLVALI